MNGRTAVRVPAHGVRRAVHLATVFVVDDDAAVRDSLALSRDAALVLPGQGGVSRSCWPTRSRLGSLMLFQRARSVALRPRVLAMPESVSPLTTV
jgi:hypothetical protein